MANKNEEAMTTQGTSIMQDTVDAVSSPDPVIKSSKRKSSRKKQPPLFWMVMFWVCFSTAVVVAALFGWWGAQQAGWLPTSLSAESNKKEPRLQPVAVSEVRQQDLMVSIAAVGTVSPVNTAVVTAKVNGEIKAILFKEGSFVKAGQALARIDAKPYEIALSQAEGVLTRDLAQLKNAEIDLARFKDLQTKHAIAKQQVDTQEAQVMQLKGVVQSDKAQVDNARLQLSYTQVLAPISGLVSLRRVDVGNYVHSSDESGLLTIAETRPINVVFTVPDKYLQKILSFHTSGKTLAVEAWDRNQKKVLAIGHLIAVDNTVDAATGTLKLKAQFDNTESELFPNQFVNIRLRLETLNNVLVIPHTALMRGAQNSFVFQVGADNTISNKTVVPIANEGGLIAIRGELSPGDRVVVDGVDRLRKGMLVSVSSVKPLPALAQDESGVGSKTQNGAQVNSGSLMVAANTNATTVSNSDNGTGAARLNKVSSASSASRGAMGAGAGKVDLKERARIASKRIGEGERPDWLTKLPPEAINKIIHMSQEDRQQWILKRLEVRAKESGRTE